MKALVQDGAQDSHKFIKWVVACQVLEARLVNLVKTVKLTPLSDPDHELLGPKMVEVPETETLPSARMDSLLDISPEAPLELCQKLRELVSCYHEAFGFDDHLGKPQVGVKIDVVLGTHPISQSQP